MMKQITKFFVAACLAVSILATSTQSQTRPDEITTSPALQALVDEAVTTTVAKFAEKKLNPRQLSITLIDLRDATRPTMASFRGNERIYPASVVKLFYLVAAHRWLEDKKIQDTAELRRALKDMIVDSSNEATHYIVDVVTHTTGGYELPPKEMKDWQYKRNAVNRYFSSLGYTNINVNQKPHCEDAYGRERVSREPKGANRNKLTTDATARLMMEIATHKAVTRERSSQMMELLKRDTTRKTSDTDSQDTGFSGSALPSGTRYWAKAGWTSTTRHDAAYVELPTGEKFVLVIFTEDHANERDIIPTVAGLVIDGIRNVK
jgi:beta-lactamase class A